MSYAFRFDAGSCTGCKACQAACKDKNNLPLGVLWRRVYEVNGGGWQRAGEAWTNTVFAYNLSLACNHCVHPKCAGVCPVDAYRVRPDGIVVIDTRVCVGCGYCAWACPYDAPQIDPLAGHMTKCDLCCDNLDAGLPPACVAACPLRCLDLVRVDDQVQEMTGVPLWKTPGAAHPFPLPDFSRTEPHLLLRPHPAMEKAASGAQVGNREEIAPLHPGAAREELPLIAFTLLAQLAIGTAWAVFLIELWALITLAGTGSALPPLLASGFALAAALLTSFLHLRKPENAWRVLKHLRKSWLSREILLLSAFGTALVLQTGAVILRIGTPWLGTALAAATAFLGFAGLYAMYNIYRLKKMPRWNTPWTLLEFATTALLLGSLVTGMLLPKTVLFGVLTGIAGTSVAAFLAAGLLALPEPERADGRLHPWRIFLIALGLVAAGSTLLMSHEAAQFLLPAIFLVALVEEGIGRWRFYSHKKSGI